MKREPKCDNCGVVITLLLSTTGNANGYLCLDCSGATLDDFLEEGVSDEDRMADRVEQMRAFHGRD